jgi:hypothetical protein
VEPFPGIIIDSTAPSAHQPTKRQIFHRDFNPQVFKWHRGAQVELKMPPTFPWTLLLMLSGPGFVYISLTSGRLVKISVPQGCAVLFRGDVLHAGAAYQERHVRAHWYLTPCSSPFNGIESLETWRENPVTQVVALHDCDPTEEWDPHTTALCEPVGVIHLTAPYIHTVSEVEELAYLKF